jgi:hypothetical protein
MDAILAPAIVLLAKSIIDTIRKDRSPGSLYVGKYDSHSTDSSDHTVTATQQVMAATLASSALFNGQCTPHEQYDSTEKKKGETSSEIDTSPKTTTNRTRKKKSQKEVDMKLIENVVERIKQELPDIIEKMHKTAPTVIPDSLDSIYISQITAAQEFINNNRKADLSQIKCILRNMLPKEYHEKIEELKEYQDPKVININGGQNLIAPNAKNAKQDIQKKV